MTIQVFGKDYDLIMTVGASEEIAKLCPGGKIENIYSVFDGKTDAEALDFAVNFIVILSNAADENAEFSGRVVDHPKLTGKMLKAMPAEEFALMQRIAMGAITESTETTVEVEPSKKKDEVTKA
jgi:hypothetical protein